MKHAAAIFVTILALIFQAQPSVGLGAPGMAAAPNMTLTMVADGAENTDDMCCVMEKSCQQDQNQQSCGMDCCMAPFRFEQLDLVAFWQEIYLSEPMPYRSFRGDHPDRPPIA